MALLESLKRYFEETPREQVLKDWQQAGEETKDVESPTVEEFITKWGNFNNPLTQNKK